MVANVARSIGFEGKFHNIKLIMGDYPSSPIYVRPIGEVEVVIGIKWFRTLGTISTNYNELFMKF